MAAHIKSLHHARWNKAELNRFRQRPTPSSRAAWVARPGKQALDVSSGE